MIDTAAVSNSELPAHVAITNLIHRYAELVDAADFDGLGEMFAEGELVTSAGTQRVALRLTALRRAGRTRCE